MSDTTAYAKVRLKRRSPLGEVWSRLRKRPVAMLSLAGILLIILVAIFADVIADYSTMVIQQDVYNKFLPASGEHWLGTDHLGRDVFGRIVHGTRTALIMGFGANIITCLIALVLACTCAFFGGKVDLVIMRFVDVLASLPSLVLALAISAGLGSGLWQLIVALAVGNIAPITQMFRSSALSEANKEYMEAGKALGASNFWMMTRYLLPNMLSIVLIQLTSYVAINILMGATLSFIGLGVKAPQPEWGMMLAEGLQYYTTYPQLVIIPGLFLVFTALCIMTFGDCLRDAFDPKLKGKS